MTDPKQTNQLADDVREMNRETERAHEEWVRTGELPKPTQKEYETAERVYNNMRKVYPPEE